MYEHCAIGKDTQDCVSLPIAQPLADGFLCEAEAGKHNGLIRRIILLHLGQESIDLIDSHLVFSLR